MKKKPINVKYSVILGYALVVVIMAIGLVALYKNLVDFSDKKIKSEDLTELFIVGKTLSLLYEVESEENMLTAESAQRYYVKYDSIIPVVGESLGELKELAKNSSRIAKIDTILFLMNSKSSNLYEVAVLLDSLNNNPKIIRETQSSYVPRELNREISDYIDSRSNSTLSDTSVVAGERKGFFDRVRNVFDGSPDSTIVIERSVVEDRQFKLIVDTIVNKVRYSERLDLSKQREFQNALFAKQDTMNYTNRMLTVRIDDLLKGIEQEEMDKSLQLITDREQTISRSQNTMLIISLIAILTAIFFAIMFLIDINRSQRYRKQLEASNKRISDLLVSREKMMLTISHDIKAPISSIQGFLELIKDYRDINSRGRDKIDVYLLNMKTSSDHVLELVTSLLDYHKLDSGKWKFSNSLFNLYRLIDDTASSFNPLASHKGIKYNIVNNIPEDFEYYGDAYALRQIMSNLISNAIKFTNEGEVSVVAEIEHQPDSTNLFEFKVKDTGVGIDEADFDTVFKEYAQIREGHESVGPNGSGLGLSITKAFVEEMNGELHLNSKKGKGSEFTVRLILTADSDPEVTEIEYILNRELDEDQLEELKDLSVLVVDDDVVLLKMVSEMINKKDMQCTVESDPDIVIHLLNNNRYDLIFIDIQLGNTSGFDLVERINQINIPEIKSVPKIALSAIYEFNTERIESSGFNNFLTKTINSAQLYSVIYYYCREIYKSEDVKPDRTKPVNVKSETLKSETDYATEKRGGSVKALIDFVKDDKIVSIQILETFINETAESTNKLEIAFKDYDLIMASKISHKVLPMIKMIGNDRVVDLMVLVEDKELISNEDKEYLLKSIKHFIKDAERLKQDLSEEADDK